MIDNVKIYYKCGRSMSQISLLALEPSSHWKGRNKAKLVHKTQMILHRPAVWFICTHMNVQRMDSGYSKNWPIFTSYQTLKIINKQHMLTLTIPAANSFSWILSIFDIGLKRAITNQYSILFLLKSWIIKCWILHILYAHTTNRGIPASLCMTRVLGRYCDI